jgi:hypothetical protein
MEHSDMKEKIGLIMCGIKRKTILKENVLELYIDLDYSVIDELRKLHYEVSYIEDHLKITW